MPLLESIQGEAPPGYQKDDGNVQQNSRTPSSGTPVTTSTVSSPASISSNSPESSALIRILAEPFEEQNDQNFHNRILGYQRVSVPREQTLLDLLIQSSGTDDLAQIQRLTEVSLRVVACLVSLSRLEIYTPNVRVLILDGSGLLSLREIGTSLNNLRILHVSRCGLTSLDGTYGLTSLIELHANDNHITNVGPCTALENIRVINLDRNPISSISNVSLLSLCPLLTRLSIKGTPLSKQPNYRQNVKNVMSGLKFLDGVYIADFVHSESLENEDSTTHKSLENKEDASESCSIDVSSLTEPSSDDFDANASLKTPEYELLPVSNDNKEDRIELRNRGRPSTALGCASTSYASQSFVKRPKSAMPKICKREESSIFSEETTEASPSFLTSGGIVCGNIARALSRARPAKRPMKPSTSKPVDDWVLGPPKRKGKKKTLKKSTQDYESSSSSSSEDGIAQSEGNAQRSSRCLSILEEAKKLIEEPIPSKPEESTPVVDLELGIASSTASSEVEVSQRWEENSKNTIRDSKKWRKAFKLYREQKHFASFSEESTISDTD